MGEIKRCFCGSTPINFDCIENGQGSKYATAIPSCCGEWLIEFKTNYKDLDSKECQKLAVEAWNNTPRMYKQ